MAAIAVGFIICASAAGPAEHASSAEAAYAEALQLAEQHGGDEGERTLSRAAGAGKGAR